MQNIRDFIRRSRRSRKIAIAAPGTPGDFRRSRRSAYKIARFALADLLHTTSSFQPMIKVNFLIGFQATTITIATVARSLSL